MINFRLDIQNYVILLTALVNFSFASFIYFKGSQKKSNISYSIFTFGVVLWSIGMFMYRGTPDHTMAVFWARFLYFASGSIPVSLLFFSFVFPNEKLNLSKLKKTIIFVLPFFIILSSFWPGFIVKDIIIERSLENEMVFGPGYNLWSSFLLCYFLWAFVNLIKTYRSSSNIVRLQIKYILIGASIALVGGTITNLILPAFGNTVLGWMGQSFTIVMVGFVSYAITHYRLMNIKFILTRSILYAILVVIVASSFSASIFLASNFFGLTSGSNKIIIYVLNSLLIVIFLDPIKRLFAKITDKIFYKDKIDYQLLLQEAGNIVAKEIDLQLLSEKLSSLIANRLKVKRVCIYDSDFNKLASSGRNTMELNNNLVGFLSVQTDIIITEELIRDIGNDRYEYESKELNRIVDSLQHLGIEMIVPIIDEDKHIAYLLLSEKQSGDLHNEEDIKFFQVLIPQIASAFEKSQLYEAVQKFNVRLQRKVDEKTKSLKEVNKKLEGRNKFLTTMQVVTNMISRTLDLKQVTQMIADSIATELGYVGGVLSFVDADRKYLRVGAITQTPETKIILDTLPENPKSYKAEMKMGYNLGVDTMLTGEMKYSKNLSDFLSPPADKEIMNVVQEALEIKTIVGVPIYSEDRVIGLIHFLLPFAEKDISSLDKETMTAMTNQVGILSRNLQLYDNLQGTNKELQEANVHLRALDKAKSEFVSIASHQLRTPISAIKGYLSMLLEGDFGELNDGVKNVTKGLFESSSRLARLVNTFLNVSRIESGRLKLDIKPVNVDKLVTSVIGELSNEATQKGLKLTYDSPRGLPRAMADSDKLREVILNLIDNSIKYTPKGSVKVSLSADDKKLSFQVKDTGIGIDPVEAKGLFRKFVRGSGVAQIHTGGSGLGLFIAQRIINEHKGKIWAESKGKEKGSAFKFEVLYLSPEDYRIIVNF